MAPPTPEPERRAKRFFFRGMESLISDLNSPFFRTNQTSDSQATPSQGESRGKIFFGRMGDYLIGYFLPILPHKQSYHSPAAHLAQESRARRFFRENGRLSDSLFNPHYHAQNKIRQLAVSTFISLFN